MTRKAKFKSDAFEASHASATALARAGAIDKATMRTFDDACLIAPGTDSSNADQKTARIVERQSTGIRALSEHQ